MAADRSATTESDCGVEDKDRVPPNLHMRRHVSRFQKFGYPSPNGRRRKAVRVGMLAMFQIVQHEATASL